MAISSADVARLREVTSVGMMDCKRALEATNGNFDEAIKYLREKGMATAAKKSGRIASEGIVDSYIHMEGKIGVLVEVNCETDFVARSEAFKELVHNIALQIAACKPECIAIGELDPAKIENERQVILAQAQNDPKPKPAAALEKIVEGRIAKFCKEVVLLEQDYVKDNDKTVGQLINEAIASMGEKITIRRFARFERGEGLEKKADNFVEEIMATVNSIK